MSISPPLTRYLGKAERTLQALLQTKLRQVNLSFPEWTILTFLNGAGPLRQDQLVEGLGSGRVVDLKEAHVLIGAMIDKGFIVRGDAGLSITTAGAELYLPLRNAVESITTELFDGIPADDLEATRRTLDAVTRRAAKLLPAGAN